MNFEIVGVDQPLESASDLAPRFSVHPREVRVLDRPCGSIQPATYVDRWLFPDITSLPDVRFAPEAALGGLEI